MLRGSCTKRVFRGPPAVFSRCEVMLRAPKKLTNWLPRWELARARALTSSNVLNIRSYLKFIHIEAQSFNCFIESKVHNTIVVGINHWKGPSFHCSFFWNYVNEIDVPTRKHFISRYSFHLVIIIIHFKSLTVGNMVNHNKVIHNTANSAEHELVLQVVKLFY